MQGYVNIYNYVLEACESPTNINSGSVIDTKNIYKPGKGVNIQCNQDYTLTNSDTTCQTGNTWAPKPSCERFVCNLPSVDNQYGFFTVDGHRVSTTQASGTTIQLQCSAGYTPSTSKTSLTCQGDGSWSGSVPSCIKIYCNDIPYIANGSYVRTGNPPYDSSIEIKPVCDEGYFNEGSIEIRRCTGINEWSGTEPICMRITCSGISPYDITNGRYNGSFQSYDYGTILVPTCETGFYISNNATPRVCQGPSKWSGHHPVCTIVRCSAPVPVPNVTFHPHIIDNDYTYNTSFQILCSKGYEEINGVTTITCAEDTTWIPSTTRCNKIRCKNTNNVQHEAVQSYPVLAFEEVGNVSYNSTFYFLTRGSLEVICSMERKLNWIAEPYFGMSMKHVFLFEIYLIILFINTGLKLICAFTICCSTRVPCRSYC